MDWDGLKLLAAKRIKELKLSGEYIERVKYELSEIDKQGANQYWTEVYESKKVWKTNPGGLVFPWLLGMVNIDPIKEGIKHKIMYQTDMPDIDTDFIPQARAIVKEYAKKEYKYVCDVGNWNTFKPKSALIDVARAYKGVEFSKEVIKVTTMLPDEFDEYTWANHEKFFEDSKSTDEKIRDEAIAEISNFKLFYDFRNKNEENKKICDIAFRIVGKIKSQGTHAGGVIIADRPIENIIPLSKPSVDGGNWVSQWTEGKSTQLSKFGLVKIDILGLKTMFYIWQAGNLIKKNLNIDINWNDMDPTEGIERAGYEIYSDGSKKVISFKDKDAIKASNDLKTESVFQIETPIQKSIIRDGGVKQFWDLVVYNALGRPGPIEMIPQWIKRRDDVTESWKKDVDPRITEILKSTYNVIVFQEQLSTMWIRLAGFTVPEAEAARKVISKKWADKLKKVEEQWMKGATKTLGELEAKRWWDQMVSFGRYAFNLAHSVAYSVITYRCLYLKTHFPAQWWSAVMTECHSDKLGNYISAARADGVQFGSLDIDNISREFTVVNGKVIPGLIFVKGVGDKASRALCDHMKNGKARDIDDVVKRFGKKKNIFERLIKLGAFDNIHPNRYGLWIYYIYKNCDKKTAKEVIDKIKKTSVWTEEKIIAERELRSKDFLKMNPKKKKIPKGILNWKPVEIELSRDEIINLFPDYTNRQKLDCEKELLGYYWSNPMILYVTNDFNIEYAKKRGDAKGIPLEVVIEDVIRKQSKKGSAYYIFKVFDGVNSADITVWSDVYHATDKIIVKPGCGIKIYVDYNKERDNFKIHTNSQIIPLLKVGDSEKEVKEELEVALI